MSTFSALFHASLSSPPPPPFLPPPSLQTATCLPATMHVTRAGCGLPHAPTRRPRRQERNARYHAANHARDPATRDGEDLRTRAPETTPRTTQGGTARANQTTPTGSTHRFARRKRNNHHHARRRIGASSRQPQGSASSWPPRARQSTTPGLPGPEHPRQHPLGLGL